MGLADNNTRHVWIIRHGKSAEGEPGQSDHDRPLNKRGRRDGAAMRAWLAQQPHPARWVWCSSASRAKETAAFVTTGFSATFVEEPNLYLASAETVLDCLRATPDDVHSVALVAHNPGLTYLVNRLGATPVTDNLVTFGTALFTMQGSWSDLTFGNARLVSLHTPKTI